MADTTDIVNMVRNHQTTDSNAQPLNTSVERTLHNYFIHLGDQTPSDLYKIVLEQVEIPLLKVTLQKTRGNQTKAAQWLGLSRGTLRKKLKQYNLD